MAVPEDLAAFYSVAFGDAEHCTVQGVAQVPGIFEVASEVLLGEALVVAPTLRLQATVVAADGGLCTVRGQSYRIRNVRLLPPDGREKLLVLARAGG